MKTALTIAGSDSSGGAGIQADIKTMSAHGIYAMSAITALTAQNTLGVKSIQAVSPAFLKDQIDAVCSDIYPDAVKIGMIPTPELMRTAADCLRRYEIRHLVLDPVMVATSGSSLMDTSALDVLKTCLAPLCEVITPNIPETEVLLGESVRSAADMEKAARKLHETYGCAVLVKGGHALEDANDCLCSDEGITWFSGKRIDNPNTHGTGCTLSSAIASNLALGRDLTESIQNAKEYISGALAYGLDLGHGHGPMNHFFDMQSRFKGE